MAATFKSPAKQVTNIVEIDGTKFYSFDNGEFAYTDGAQIKCCNRNGRGFANTGRFAELVMAQRQAIARAEQ